MNNNDRNSEQNKMLDERFEHVAVALQPHDGPLERVSKLRCKKCGWLSDYIEGPLTHQCPDPIDDAPVIENETTGFAEDTEFIQEEPLIE